jgi:hypothetical protein
VDEAMTTRKYSEGEVRAALDDMDLELFAYKPQDAFGPGGQKKPCDFMVWFLPEAEHVAVAGCTLHEAASAWIEVKSTPAMSTLNTRLFAPSQLLGMRLAYRVKLPYWIVVHWPKRRAYTIGPASIVLGKPTDEGLWPPLLASIPITAFPIRCAPGQLASHLRLALLGEVD